MRRYSCKNAAVATGGTVYAHGLSHQTGGAAMTPDEWFFNKRSVDAGLLFLTAVGTTSITISTTAATGLLDVFASVVHSICE